GTGWTTGAGGAGADTKGNINTTIGNGTCDGAGLHTQLDIPVRSQTWIDSVCNPSNTASGYPDCCTAADLEAGEAVAADFSFILSPTTETTSAAFTDTAPTGNGDGCSFSGFGPAGPFTDTG